MDISREVSALKSGVESLSQRVDYLHVAVMRGDPRYSKPEYAKPDFDTDAFDREWLARGKRVPSQEEIMGER